MACGTCQENNQQNFPDLNSVNLFKFDLNRNQIRNPYLPDSLPVEQVHQAASTSKPNSLLEPTPTPTPPKDLPSLKQMAFSLTSAIKDTILNATKEGVVLATPDVLLKRMDICVACEFFIHNTSRCSKCGCFMNFKARLAVSKCPVGKW